MSAISPGIIYEKILSETKHSKEPYGKNLVDAVIGQDYSKRKEYYKQ